MNKKKQLQKRIEKLLELLQKENEKMITKKKCINKKTKNE